MTLSASPFPPGARVVAYLRDSGHEDQELSTAQQEAALRAWCSENHLTLTQVFVDAAAPGSTTTGRAAFQQLVAHFRAPTCSDVGVVLWKFSRFARDFDDAAYHKADLRRRGYVVHSINDAVPEGLDGRLFEAAVDWMNARYLADLRTDIVRGQRSLLRDHGALGGTPPRGFKREIIEIGARRDGRPHTVARWVPDPDLVDLVQLAFLMRARGASLKEIHAATGLYKSINSYITFFANRIYIGELLYGGEIIPDYCEPIVDRDTWDAVQALIQASTRSQHLSGDNPTHPRRAASVFLLSGLLYCGDCGAPMNGETLNFRATAAYTYTYYYCTVQQRRAGCTAKKLPAPIVENAVLETLTEFVLAEHNLSEHHRALTDQDGKQRRLIQAEQKSRLRTLDQIRRKIAHLTDAIEAAGHSKALLERLSALEREESAQKTELARLKSILHDPQPLSLQEITRRARTIAQRLANHEPAYARQILQGLIARITARLDLDANLIRGHITYYYPPEDPPPESFESMDRSPPGAPIHRLKFSVPYAIPRSR